jgi:hypothetical protein
LAIGGGAAAEAAAGVVRDVVAAISDVRAANPGAVTARAAVSQDGIGDGYATGEVAVVVDAAAGVRGRAIGAAAPSVPKPATLTE